LLTTTSFGVNGATKLHTQLVRCPDCKGQLAFHLEPLAHGKARAIAEDLSSGQKHVLVEWPEP
jgi:hypothetical protein